MRLMEFSFKTSRSLPSEKVLTTSDVLLNYVVNKLYQIRILPNYDAIVQKYGQ